MVTFVFAGMLVDAARYRMASVYLESALDSASESVLSNYNRLLFDLYGLFSVEIGDGSNGAASEAEMKTKIEEMYNRYLDATLKTADIKLDAKYRTMLNDIFDEMTGKETEKANVGTGNLYDFKVENLDCGTTITLADSANVESQIIEHMKFRAPVQLIDETKGFLTKINSLLTMTDRIGEALTKTKITKRYEEAGLSEKAYALQQDINKFAVNLYNYSIDPTKPLGLENMLDRNNVYGKNPCSIRNEIIKVFDEEIDRADKEFNDAILNENEEYSAYLTSQLSSLQGKIIIEEQESTPLMLTAFYAQSGGGKTNLFTAIDFGELEPSDKITLAEDVYNQVAGRSGEIYERYQRDFKQEQEAHQQEVDKIKKELKKKYQTARSILETSLNYMENNAGVLYDEISKQGGLRDRMTEVVGLYESYIAELEAERQKDGGSQNKESVYAPEIELAEGNLAEILKNADILLNSRLYLNNIAEGFPDENGNNREKLSKWVLIKAEQIISHRKDYYIENKEAASGEIPEEVTVDLREHRLYELTKAENVDSKTGEQSKDLFMTKYSDFIGQAVGEVVLEAQNHICILYSYASYFQTCYYRADVDVQIGEGESDAEKIKNTKIDSNAETEQNEQEEDKANKLPLDNEAMLQDSNYLEYLKVNYQTTQREENLEDTQLGESVNEKVTLNTLERILETGLNLLKKLEGLLEDARDNLYIDAYILSMLPNYSEFQRYNADEYTSKNLPLSFTAEYLQRNSSFAAAEYIITGAGSGGAELSDKIKAPENEGDMGVGYGKLSVNSMRMKLFGTRLLFNGVSMLTDTAKLKQAARMSSWAHAFAPIVAAVLVIAWTIAETVIDVMVIMCEPAAKFFDPDKTGEVYIFKQGKDWFFCLENGLNQLAKMAVNSVLDKVEEKAVDLTKSLEQQTNQLIYDAYKQVKDGTAQVADALNNVSAKSDAVIDGWTNELENRVGMIETDDPIQQAAQQEAQQQIAEVSGEIKQKISFSNEVNKVKDKIDDLADGAQYQAAIAVSRASAKVTETTKETMKKIKGNAADFIDKNIQNVIPIGEVVNSGSAQMDKSPKMGYRDYLYFYLFFMSNDLKIKRLQSVIQANIMVSEQKNFRMETSPVSVWADMKCSMKYMFMSNLIVPEWIRRDGRLQLKVISGQSY